MPTHNGNYTIERDVAGRIYDLLVTQSGVNQDDRGPFLNHMACHTFRSTWVLVGSTLGPNAKFMTERGKKFRVTCSPKTATQEQRQIKEKINALLTALEQSLLV